MIISVGVYGFWSRKLPEAVKAPGSAKRRRRRSVAGFCPMDRTRAGSRGGRAAAAGSHAPPGVAQGSAHASAASWAPSPGLSGHQPWDPPDLLVAEPERPPASPAGHLGARLPARGAGRAAPFSLAGAGPAPPLGPAS